MSQTTHSIHNSKRPLFVLFGYVPNHTPYSLYFSQLYDCTLCMNPIPRNHYIGNINLILSIHCGSVPNHMPYRAISNSSLLSVVTLWMNSKPRDHYIGNISSILKTSHYPYTGSVPNDMPYSLYRAISNSPLLSVHYGFIPNHMP